MAVSYRIVGPDEFDVKADIISMESPLARSLLRCRPDDEMGIHLRKNGRLILLLKSVTKSRDKFLQTIRKRAAQVQGSY
ncbi:GreA/GreB family elongation factor [Microbulbifer variabilis]|uniref:GreA/GreB family elongation factor n=1 Tax=Microbulbifer variabilis TaxID=266805 RepID=UPI001CFE5899